MSNSCTSYPASSDSAPFYAPGYGSVVVTLTPGPSMATCGASIPVWFYAPGISGPSTKYVRFDSGPQSNPGQGIVYCYNDPPNGNTNQQCLGPNSSPDSGTSFYTGTTQFFSFTQPTQVWITVYDGTMIVGTGTVPGLQSTILGSIEDSAYLNQVTSVGTNNLNFEVTTQFTSPSCPPDYSLPTTGPYDQDCLSVQGCFSDLYCQPCNSATSVCFYQQQTDSQITLNYDTAMGVINPTVLRSQASAGARTRVSGSSCSSISTCTTGTNNPFFQSVPTNTCDSSYQRQCVRTSPGSTTDCQSATRTNGKCPSGCSTPNACPTDAQCSTAVSDQATCTGCCNGPQSFCAAATCGTSATISPTTLNCGCYSTWQSTDPDIQLCIPCDCDYVPQVYGADSSGIFFICVKDSIQITVSCQATSGTIVFEELDNNGSPVPGTSQTLTQNQTQAVNVMSGGAISFTTIKATIANPCGPDLYTEQFQFCPFVIDYSEIQAGATVTFSGEGAFNWDTTQSFSSNPFQGCVGTLAISATNVNLTKNSSGAEPYSPTGCSVPLYNGQLKHCNKSGYCPVPPSSGQ